MRKWMPALIMGVSPFFVVLSIVLSILYGAKNMDASTVWDAIFRFDPADVNHQIIRASRLPRAIGALLIGAFLAVSGAIMQGMTRNDLASPSIMGVSDGSAFVITGCIILMPGSTGLEMILYSMLGSLLGVSIVFTLASLTPGGMSPVRLAVIGTIVGSFLSGVSQAMASYFQVSQNVSFWYNARLHQLNPELVKMAIPFGLVGLVIAFAISRSLTILSLSEEVAAGLGQRTRLVKAFGLMAIVLLTGVSVALAGKIAFVGLIVPHIVRFLVGVDYKRIIPCSAIIGGVFLALADVGSRFMNYPFETPIGVVTAIVGVPFFLYLIRTRGGRRYA